MSKPKLPPNPPTFTPCDHKMAATTTPGVLKCLLCPYELELVQGDFGHLSDLSSYKDDQNV